jgi:hypothetical protein
MKALFTGAKTFTDVDAQREYVEASHRNVGFAAHGTWPKMVWHYLFLPHQTDPQLREKYGPAPAYLFSLTEQENHFAITPVKSTLDWTNEAQAVNQRLFPS